MSAELRIDLPLELVETIASHVADQLVERMPTPAEMPVANGRIALSRAEAAEAIGVSVDHLERHVLPELRTVRSGRLRLIPTAELEAWVEANAARLGEWR